MNNTLHNVLFITVDSTRYDAALAAHTPFLDSIAKLRAAETTATYTFPAHHSFFIGILPRPLDGDECYVGEYQQIWRSMSARESDKSVFEVFTEKNIIDHYIEKGSQVFGYGGVSFFNSEKPGNTLPKMFPNFKYFPNTEGVKGSIPRDSTAFPLAHHEEIARRINDNAPYFLFVNESATHIPYDNPTTTITNDYKTAVEKLYKEHYSLHAHFYSNETLPLSTAEIDLLKKRQVQSLEWADDKIRQLFSKLPKSYPTLVLVIADHGEEFGENGRFGHAHVSENVLKVPLWAGIVEHDA